MLKRLYVDNYKRLVNFEVSFGELTLLLGPNGAGKSSVFDVVFALRQLLGGTSKVNDPDIFPTSTLTRWQNRRIQVFELDVELEGDALRYRLEIEHEPDHRKTRVKKEELIGGGKPLFSFVNGNVQLYRDNHSKGPDFPADWSMSDLGRVPPAPENKRLTRFLEYMRKLMVCGLYPRSFATESTTEDPLLARDGANFAAWYRHVLQERQDLIPPYHAALADVIDGFKAIRLEKTGIEARACKVMFEDTGAPPFELKLDELSDGQRAIIALYALVHVTAGQGYTLLLDEPDNYVALPEIQPWLMALADACGHQIPQAILCSHHPELIDYLGGDRGLILSRESSGVIVARKPGFTGSDPGLKLSEIIARGWER
jgi:predicted ATPase